MDKIKGALDPSGITELYLYDTDAVMTALKIRKASKKGEIAGLIGEYNESINGLKQDNLTTVAGLGMSLKELFANKAFKDIFSTRADYKQQMSAIKAEKIVLHSDLEDQLDEALTRRQERKWNKYKEERRQAMESQFALGDLMEYIGF